MPKNGYAKPFGDNTFNGVKNNILGIIYMQAAAGVPTTYILDDHFTDLFENILSLNVPLISAPDYLVRIRKRQLVKPIDEFLGISREEKEKLLAPLIDFVASIKVSDPEITEKIAKDFKKRLETDIGYGRIIGKLERYFASLTSEQQIHVITHTIQKVITRTSLIRSSIKTQILKEENPYPLFVLNQALYMIQEFAKDSLQYLRKSPQRFDPDKSKLNLVMVALLKIEAVREGKMSMEQISDEISLMSRLIKPKYAQIEEKMIEPILSALAT